MSLTLIAMVVGIAIIVAVLVVSAFTLVTILGKGDDE